MQDDSLNNLLEKNLKANASEVLEVLFTKYYKVLVIFAKNYVNDRVVAEDIVQDVFVMMYEKSSKLKIHTSVKSFLYTSVRNHALNYLKKTKTVLFDQELIDEDIAVYDEETINVAELSEKLYKAIEKLPTQNQNIFKLSRLEGYSNQEIANELGLTKRTVETHISNALKRLKVFIKENNFIFFTCFCFLIVLVLDNR